MFFDKEYASLLWFKKLKYIWQRLGRLKSSAFAFFSVKPSGGQDMVKELQEGVGGEVTATATRKGTSAPGIHTKLEHCTNPTILLLRTPPKGIISERDLDP